jgi:hypothetical protein
VYEGEKLKPERNPMLSVLFCRINTKTLTDKEIDKIMQRLADGF